MRKTNWKQAITFILFTELVGLVSSLLAGNIRETYSQLIKPPFSPPGWLFGIVWPLLYALIGIAAYLIFRSRAHLYEKKYALCFYLIQLAFNFMWSIIFFRFESFWGALIVLIILDVLVSMMLLLFSKINRTAAWLITPYLIWILFATYLNAGTALLN